MASIAFYLCNPVYLRKCWIYYINGSTKPDLTIPSEKQLWLFRIKSTKANVLGLFIILSYTISNTQLIQELD